MYFRLPTDVAASGYRYGCIGLQIWLRWVKDSTASGYRYGCVGLRIRQHRVKDSTTQANGVVSVDFSRRLDSLTEPSGVADRTISVFCCIRLHAKVYIIEPNSAQLVLIVPKWTSGAPPMLYLCISIREETGAQHYYSQF